MEGFEDSLWGLYALLAEISFGMCFPFFFLSFAIASSLSSLSRASPSPSRALSPLPRACSRFFFAALALARVRAPAVPAVSFVFRRTSKGMCFICESGERESQSFGRTHESLARGREPTSSRICLSSESESPLLVADSS